jgi:hypothetical protein
MLAQQLLNEDKGGHQENCDNIPNETKPKWEKEEQIVSKSNHAILVRLCFGRNRQCHLDWIAR